MTEKTHLASNAAASESPENASFDVLLKRFNESSCEANSFALAVYLYTRFPEEAKRLLPLIKGEQLDYDGKTDPAGTNYEWAAALTAAKHLKDKNKIAIEVIDSAAIQGEAHKIYADGANRLQQCRAR